MKESCEMTRAGTGCNPILSCRSSQPNASMTIDACRRTLSRALSMSCCFSRRCRTATIRTESDSREWIDRCCERSMFLVRCSFPHSRCHRRSTQWDSVMEVQVLRIYSESPLDTSRHSVLIVFVPGSSRRRAIRSLRIHFQNAP